MLADFHISIGTLPLDYQNLITDRYALHINETEKKSAYHESCVQIRFHHIRRGTERFSMSKFLVWVT